MLPLGFVALEGMVSSGKNSQCKCKEVGARSHRKGRADRRAPLEGTKSTEMHRVCRWFHSWKTRTVFAL